MIFRNKNGIVAIIYFFMLQPLQHPLYIIFLYYLCGLNYSHAPIRDVAEIDCLTKK